MRGLALQENGRVYCLQAWAVCMHANITVIILSVCAYMYGHIDMYGICTTGCKKVLVFFSGHSGRDKSFPPIIHNKPAWPFIPSPHCSEETLC
jgi:hypothetical protein